MSTKRDLCDRLKMTVFDSPSSWSPSIVARLADKPAGVISLYRNSAAMPTGRKISCLSVGNIDLEADAPSRCGIGTALYEAAARMACKEGRHLCSDANRTAKSEGFWRKQETRGRAVCVPGLGTKLNENMDPVSFWSCEKYVLDPECPKPRLDGVRRKTR